MRQGGQLAIAPTASEGAEAADQAVPTGVRPACRCVGPPLG